MDKQRIYTGNIIDLYKNPLKCLKKLLKLDNVETLKNHVYRDNKRVIKILKYCDDGLLTCKLTEEASKLGIGVKFLGYDIIYHKSILSLYEKKKSICIYLYTEYNTPVTRDINKKLVIELAKKIANTKLKFHPDFWYENLILNKDNILVAIDWDGSMYRERRAGKKLFSPHILVEKMLKYYKSVEEYLNPPYTAWDGIICYGINI